MDRAMTGNHQPFVQLVHLVIGGLQSPLCYFYHAQQIQVDILSNWSLLQFKLLSLATIMYVKQQDTSYKPSRPIKKLLLTEQYYT